MCVAYTPSLSVPFDGLCFPLSLSSFFVSRKRLEGGQKWGYKVERGTSSRGNHTHIFLLWKKGGVGRKEGKKKRKGLFTIPLSILQFLFKFCFFISANVKAEKIILNSIFKKWNLLFIP